eukprot:Em0003g505a
MDVRNSWVFHVGLFKEMDFLNQGDRLSTIPTPAVPYIGVFLKDLTFICDGNRDYLRGGLINVHKRRQLEPKMVVHRRATRYHSSTNLSSTTPNFSFFKPNSKYLSTTTLRT